MISKLPSGIIMFLSNDSIVIDLYFKHFEWIMIWSIGSSLAASVIVISI